MTAIQEKLGCEPRTSKSITATYEHDLAWAREFIAERFDNPHPAEEAEKAVNDALANTWHDGITIERWAFTAVQRIGLLRP